MILEPCCSPNEKCCIKYGKTKKFFGKQTYKYPNELKEKVIELYLNGYKMREISGILKIPFSTIRRWIHEKL
ncbi:MAG: helix-turn-helix domain-containing protein [candidate division WOR-3 bacterium]